MHRRINAPENGFLRIVPNTGCFSHSYPIYNGVEFGDDYSFGHNNKLEVKDMRMSAAH